MTLPAASIEKVGDRLLEEYEEAGVNKTISMDQHWLTKLASHISGQTTNEDETWKGTLIIR
jgi:hypothetical protein